MTIQGQVFFYGTSFNATTMRYLLRLYNNNIFDYTTATTTAATTATTKEGKIKEEVGDIFLFPIAFCLSYSFAIIEKVR